MGLFSPACRRKTRLGPCTALGLAGQNADTEVLPDRIGIRATSTVP